MVLRFHSTYDGAIEAYAHYASFCKNLLLLGYNPLIPGVTIQLHDQILLPTRQH